MLSVALPGYLEPSFVVAYFTGARLRELLAWTWNNVDFVRGFVTLNAEDTKRGYTRAVPIFAVIGASSSNDRETRTVATVCFTAPDEQVFSVSADHGMRSREVPGLNFRDLRRTAVCNMRRPRRAMRKTGHRTESMEPRYNIVDVEDIRSAKILMALK